MRSILDKELISVDGFGETGKGSICAQMAKFLRSNGHEDTIHVNTGTYYRAATYVALESGIDFEDFNDDSSEALAHTVNKKIIVHPSGLYAPASLADNTEQDLTNELRSDEVSKAVSAYSGLVAIRSFANQSCKDIAEDNKGIPIIFDGRAERQRIAGLKNQRARLMISLFVNADPEVRANRQIPITADIPPEEKAELLEKREEKKQALIARDLADSTRETEPVVQPAAGESVPLRYRDMADRKPGFIVSSPDIAARLIMSRNRSELTRVLYVDTGSLAYEDYEAVAGEILGSTHFVR